ncbi:MAG: lamin tail domain-containing protein [Deltaproteobacteria bacterium]|nr:lamin tail domain-containing protein [Deltaproteobacteria bacterium]
MNEKKLGWTKVGFALAAMVMGVACGGDSASQKRPDAGRPGTFPPTEVDSGVQPPPPPEDDAGTPPPPPPFDAGQPPVEDAGTPPPPPPADSDGDGTPDATDNCPQLANAGQEDGDADGVGDACDNCPTIYNPQQNASACAAQTETEPNNTIATATQLTTVPGVLNGTIGAPTGATTDDAGVSTGGEADLDFFKFSANAGDLFQVTVTGTEPQSPLKPMFVVAQIRDGRVAWLRYAVYQSGSSVTRQVLLPETGEYILLVAESTNGDDNPNPVGGAAFAYSLTVNRVVPAAVAAALPLTQSNSFNTQGALHLLKVTAPNATSILEAFTKARDLATPSNANTILTLWDPAAKKVLGENDDKDDQSTDSFLRARMPQGETWLVVDFYALEGANTDFEVTAALRDGTQELEPNDQIGQAFPLGLPGQVTGTVGAPTADPSDPATMIPDYDVYSINVTAGQFISFRANATSADLDPYLIVGQVVDGFFGPQFLAVGANNDSDGKNARLDLLFAASGTYYVVVTDYRNSQEGATPVGGATFGYSLTSEAATMAPTAITVGTPASGAVNPGGTRPFYKLTAAAGALVELTLSGVAADVQPVVTLYASNGYTPLKTVSGTSLVQPISAAGDYLISVGDKEWRGGVGYTFTLTAKSTTPVAAAETEPNDTCSVSTACDQCVQVTTKAAPVVGTPIKMTGAFGTATDKDNFKLTGLKGGTTLTLILAPGASGKELDTQLDLLDECGNRLARNDDDGASPWSAIRKFKVPGSGKTGVNLIARASLYGQDTGDYALFIIVEGCEAVSNVRRAQAPTASTADLVMTEVLYDPATGTAGDANKDGVTNASDDEFVEFVNTSGVTLDIGGLEVRDSVAAPNTNKYTFACGTTLPAGGAAVVFGGGVPKGMTVAGGGAGNAKAPMTCQTLREFGQALVCAVPGTNSLGLTNSSDTATLADGATVLDSTTWNLGSIDVSLARPAVRSAAFVKSCTGTTCSPRFTPGAKQDSEPWAGRAANDTCAQAAPVAFGTQVAGTLVNATSDGAPSCGTADTVSVVYALTVTGTDAVSVKAELTDAKRMDGTSSMDVALFVRSACADANAELGCASSSFFTPGAAVDVVLSPGTYYVLVGGLTAADQGTFKLLVTNNGAVQTREGSDTCDPSATPLISNGETIKGTTTGKTNDYDSDTAGDCSHGAAYDQPDVAYKLELATGASSVTVSVTGLGGWDTLLYVRTDCAAPATELSCNDDDNLTVGKSKVEMTNVAAGTYYIIVDGYGAGAADPGEPARSGDFLLNVQVTP